MESNRIEYIDFAKGICAFFVVVAHSRCASLNILESFYCYFFLTLFFILSGVWFKYQPGKGGKKYILRITRKLIVPYFILAFLSIICLKSFWSAIYTFDIRYILYFFKPILVGDTFWFVANLILVQFTYILLLYVFRMFNIILIKIFIVLLGFSCIFFIDRGNVPGHLAFNIDTLPLTLAYFSLGSLLGDSEILFKLKRTRIGLVMSLTALIAYTLLVYFIPENHIDMHLNQFGVFPIRFLIFSSIGCCVIIFFSANYSIGLFIKKLGKYSLIVYCTQRTAFVLATYSLRLFTTDSIIENNIIISTLYIILTCIYCLSFAYIFKKYFPIVLGRTK